MSLQSLLQLQGPASCLQPRGAFRPLVGLEEPERQLLTRLLGQRTRIMTGTRRYTSEVPLLSAAHETSR